MQLLGTIVLLNLLQASVCQNLDWSSSLPITIKALKGSCVVIPCTFTYPGPRRSSGEFHLVWFLHRKSSYPEAYNSRGPGSVQDVFKSRTHAVGDLGNNECSLQINDVKDEDAEYFYPWIDPDTNSHKFYHDTTQITITDTPEVLSLLNPGVMTEGRLTKINCSVEHTCPSTPPILTWNSFGSNATISHENLNYAGRWKTTSVLNYLPSYEHDGKSLQCMAKYANQQQSADITVYIRYPPKQTKVSVVGNSELKEGNKVTLTCTCQSNPTANTYKWYHGPDKKALPDTNQNITVTDIKIDSMPYYCSAKNELGFAESAPMFPRIEYGSRILPESNCTVIPSGVMCHCLAEGRPSPTLSWHIPTNLQINCMNHNFNISTSIVSDVRVVSILMATKGSAVSISCSAANRHGFVSHQLPITLQYKPIIMKDGNCTFSDGGVLCFCTAKGNPLPSIKWRIPGGTTSANDSHLHDTVTSILQGTVSEPMNISCSASNTQGTTELYLSQFTEGILLGTRPLSTGAPIMKVLNDQPPLEKQEMHVSGKITNIVAAAAVFLVLCIIFAIIFYKSVKKSKDQHQEVAINMQEAIRLSIESQLNVKTQIAKERKWERKWCLKRQQNPHNLYINNCELPGSHDIPLGTSDQDYRDEFENIAEHQDGSDQMY